MSEALGQVSADLVPARPFLLAGQMTTTDSTRSPDGHRVHLGLHPRATRACRRRGRRSDHRRLWDHAECERFADRIQSRIERSRPWFRGAASWRGASWAPASSRPATQNLDGGSINGGTSQLHQQLVFRPVPGLGRAETGIRGLYLASSSAHPGGGVHGAPGMNAARAALAPPPAAPRGVADGKISTGLPDSPSAARDPRGTMNAAPSDPPTKGSRWRGPGSRARLSPHLLDAARSRCRRERAASYVGVGCCQSALSGGHQAHSHQPRDASGADYTRTSGPCS